MQGMDESILALTCWRENRGAGRSGMQSVCNVVMNRVKRHRTTPYEECTAREQFSSITAEGDPQLTTWPQEADPVFAEAMNLANAAVAGSLPDLTDGATLYYAPHSIRTTKTYRLPDGSIVPFPAGWNEDVVQYTVTIGGQVFFREA